MNKLFFISLFISVVALSASGQDIGNLMLDENEIPDDYTENDQLTCSTPNAFAFYDQNDLYENQSGKLVEKSFQTFQKKGDCGAILYFKFANDFTAKAFLGKMLWGKTGRPTRNQPDEYFVKGNILVIWSFSPDSPMAKISKAKVMRLLQ